MVLSDAASIYASYPTQAHRTIGKELAELQPKQFTTDTPSLAQAKRDSQLMNTSETRYTIVATIASAVVSFMIYVYLVWRLYIYSRKKRFTSRYRLSTVGTVTIGSVLASTVAAPITSAILGFDAVPNIVPAFSIFSSLILPIILTGLFTVLIVIVLESWYKKRHSLVIE